MQNRIEEINRQIMTLRNCEKVDVAAIYDSLENEENHGMALQTLLENIDSQKLSHVLEDKKVQKLESNYAKMIEGMVGVLVKRRLEPTEFYKELWKKVIDGNPMFENRGEKEYALVKICKNKYIPYYKMSDGLRMTNKEFSNCLEGMREQAKQISFIMQFPFEQKTERTSQLNDVLKSVETDEQRAVLLVFAFAEMEQTVIERLLKPTVKIEKREDASMKTSV